MRYPFQELLSKSPFQKTLFSCSTDKDKICAIPWKAAVVRKGRQCVEGHSSPWGGTAL